MDCFLSSTGIPARSGIRLCSNDNDVHVLLINQYYRNLYKRNWSFDRTCNLIFYSLNSNCLTSFIYTVVTCKYANVRRARYFGQIQFYYALKSLHTVVTHSHIQCCLRYLNWRITKFIRLSFYVDMCSCCCCSLESKQSFNGYLINSLCSDRCDTFETHRHTQCIMNDTKNNTTDNKIEHCTMSIWTHFLYIFMLDMLLFFLEFDGWLLF